jgi:L-lactate dehydrogenase complex protein LldF
VCPVRIDLHGQLLAWRREAPATPVSLRIAARLAAAVLGRAWLYRASGRVVRGLWPLLGRRWPGNPVGAWLRARELPAHPGPSFRARFARRGRKA